MLMREHHFIQEHLTKINKECLLIYKSNVDWLSVHAFKGC
jgi:hypothetical protein